MRGRARAITPRRHTVCRIVYFSTVRTLVSSGDELRPTLPKVRRRSKVRVEAFNALNHTNLGTPNRFVNTPQFGTITEAATPAREIQFGARLSF